MSKKSPELQGHQIRVREYFKKDHGDNQRGILLYHSVGTGKTITSIVTANEIIKGLKINKVLVMTPASLKQNYSDELARFKQLDKKKYKIVSFNTPQVIKQIKTVDDTVVVVDECHNLFSMVANNSKIGEYLYQLFLTSKNTKFIFLSGTPIINTPYELALLFNVLKPGLFFNKLYFTKDEFENVYLLHPHFQKEFAYKIKGLVSYYIPIGASKDYANVRVKDINLKISPLQEKMYNYYKKLENKQLVDINRQQEMYKIYTRQVCDFAILNSSKSTKELLKEYKLNDLSPKYSKLLQLIQESPGPVLIYSNFKEVGINVIADLLKQNKVSYLEWTGDQSENERKTALETFNAKKNCKGAFVKCFLITSAGAEGISLKNVRQVHIIEPHWNENRNTQVIGRAVRFNSHADLPPFQRNVNVYKYYVLSTKFKTSDLILKETADKKQKLIDRFMKLVIISSFDCRYTQTKCLM